MFQRRRLLTRSPCSLESRATTRGTNKHSPGIDAGEALLVLRRCGFAPGQPESQEDSREH
jgi:hypothetical protein